MTNDQIRLHFGELNASEMRLARAIVGWHEAREAKLRAAADGLAESLERAMGIFGPPDILPESAWVTTEEIDKAWNGGQAALAAYQATKP
jgi:hypothetical protein